MGLHSLVVIYKTSFRTETQDFFASGNRRLTALVYSRNLFSNRINAE
jgi:molybdopterin-guanine dinucleotide biosynthesis protein A